jgi:uncharacterized protein with HEPN domain
MNLNDIIKSLDDITRLLQTIAQDLDQDDFTTADQMHTAATNTTAMELIAECTAHLIVTKNTRRQPYE